MITSMCGVSAVPKDLWDEDHHAKRGGYKSTVEANMAASFKVEVPWAFGESAGFNSMHPLPAIRSYAMCYAHNGQSEAKKRIKDALPNRASTIQSTVETAFRNHPAATTLA